MHWIDWLIVVVPVLFVGCIAFKTQKYVVGVSDFLTAGRVAGRYVICVAGAEAAFGVVSLVAMFEVYYCCVSFETLFEGFAVFELQKWRLPAVLSCNGHSSPGRYSTVRFAKKLQRY